MDGLTFTSGVHPPTGALSPTVQSTGPHTAARCARAVHGPLDRTLDDPSPPNLSGTYRYPHDPGTPPAHPPRLRPQAR